MINSLMEQSINLQKNENIDFQLKLAVVAPKHYIFKRTQMPQRPEYITGAPTWHIFLMI